MAHPRSAINELESVKALGERYGVPTFANIDSLLQSGIALDGLLVCTSHASHFELSAKALARNVHILCEKPMTTDVAEARELAALAEAAAERGTKFMVNNTANWRKHAVSAASMVRGGRLGKVEHVVCVMHSPLLWLFDDAANTGWVKPSGTMVGNGFGYGQLSHLLAWVFGVTGLEPSAAFCSMGQSAKSGADMHDAAVISCSGGASICVSGTATVPGDAHAEAGGDAHSVGKHGDDQNPRSGCLELRRRDGQYESLPGFLFENYAQSGPGPESLHAFVDICAGNEAYIGVDAAVGLQTVAALDAMYRSSVSGQVERTL